MTRADNAQVQQLLHNLLYFLILIEQVPVRLDRDRLSTLN
jgi:hypothetical protein